MTRAEYLKKHIKVRNILLYGKIDDRGADQYCKLKLHADCFPLFLDSNELLDIFLSNLFAFMFQMQETQRDVSLDRESLTDSVRSCEFSSCVEQTISLAMMMWY